MRLYTIQYENCEYVAIEGNDKKLYALPSLGFSNLSMNELIDSWSDVKDDLAQKLAQPPNHAEGLDISQVTLLSPIPAPAHDIVCLGVNYADHIEETKHVGLFEKTATVYFSKRVHRAIGDGAFIPHYEFVDSLDYEVELGVILQKDLFQADEASAREAIFGYTIINDISGRNVQQKHQQWFLGKSLDGYTSIGPCIVTADELTDPQNLAVSCKVGGELRQNSHTKHMITTVIEALVELTQGMTLTSGSILSTGTPGGVAMGMNPPKYLKSGDVVECEIERIGILRNVVE